MLPTTLTIDTAAMAGHSEFANIGAVNYTLTGMAPTRNEVKYRGDSVGLQVNGATRGTLDRSVEASVSHKDTNGAKSKSSLARMVFPEQGNYNALTVGEVDDGKTTITVNVTRRSTSDPVAIEEAYIAALGVFSDPAFAAAMCRAELT